MIDQGSEGVYLVLIEPKLWARACLITERFCGKKLKFQVTYISTQGLCKKKANSGNTNAHMRAFAQPQRRRHCPEVTSHVVAYVSGCWQQPPLKFARAIYG